jgi:glyoxalase family protein
MELDGLHHVTAVTSDAVGNLDFYTNVLGMRLVKKTVNQDDVKAYHLFYADAVATPGTDMTFFDWPKAGLTEGDTDGIVGTMFRVEGKATLDFWIKRFDTYKVRHAGIEVLNGRNVVRFADPEGQRLTLVDGQGDPFHGTPWFTKEISEQHAIRGFFAIQLAIPNILLVDGIFTNVLGMTRGGSYKALDRPDETVTIYKMKEGGSGYEVHVVEREGYKWWIGAGGVHHVAFKVKDAAAIEAWTDRLDQVRLGNSGEVERYYFKSLYFRITEGILFEIATEGPGFAVDEDMDHLGQKLALPPFLEDRREEIEAGLRPL